MKAFFEPSGMTERDQLNKTFREDEWPRRGLIDSEGGNEWLNLAPVIISI